MSDSLQSHGLQAPLSMGFSRQEYCSGCLPPVDLPNQGSNLHLVGLAALAGGVFTSSVTWEARESLANLFEKGLLQAQTASPVSGSERGSFGSESVQDLGSLISW